MNRLNVFVSSTCYDLSQIRADLRSYLESSGHNPVLSEFENFPIDPAQNTIENCVSAVRNNADIFLLIVGGRYGSEIDTGKSITNTEFLAAKDKGIPIYAFINRKALNCFEIWKKNKSADFADFVDTPKIFEFILELREAKLWMFEFDTAQDIISVLKTQMSYLFKESLKIREKFNTNLEDVFKQNLSSEALNLIFEKPYLYELEFFFQTMIDELKKKEVIKNDYNYAIILNSKHAIHDYSGLIHWQQQRVKILQNLIDSLRKLIENALPEFYGKPGNPADLKGLYYVSETYARIFENIITWTIETAGTYVKEECTNLRDKLANLSSKSIEQIWEFPFNQKKRLLSQIQEKRATDKSILELESILKIEIDEIAMTEYSDELRKFNTLVLNEVRNNYI